MRNYIIKRLLLIPLTLLGILSINFAIIQLAPGGPVEYMLAKYQGLNVDSKIKASIISYHFKKSLIPGFIKSELFF